MAKQFKKWVTGVVLPSLRKYGSYSIPKFDDSNMISNYDNKNVLYIGYIGKYDDEPLYKFGKSSNIYARDYASNKKTLNLFDIVYIAVCDNKDEVEQKFKKRITS